MVEIDADTVSDYLAQEENFQNLQKRVEVDIHGSKVGG